jgi:hypothetical protein
VVERKTSAALETNLTDVGTMLDSMSSKCQDASSQVLFDPGGVTMNFPQFYVTFLANRGMRSWPRLTVQR